MSRIERIVKELGLVRTDLLTQLKRVDQEEFEWEPYPGMKSVKAQLDEIGRMEKVCINQLMTGELLDWQSCVTWPGEDLAAYQSGLEKVREETLSLISGLSDSDLDTEGAIPEIWARYWGSTSMPKEEMIRWVIRHEYYHVGQITMIMWSLGKNPYDQN